MALAAYDTVGMCWSELMTHDIDWEGMVPVVTYAFTQNGKQLMVADIVPMFEEGYWAVHISNDDKPDVEYFSTIYYPAIHDAYMAEEDYNILIESWKSRKNFPEKA
jgi:hypothetical protein